MEHRHENLGIPVGPQLDLATGQYVPDGGFTVTMKVADLSSAALTQELADTGSQSLLWVFRFANGYLDSAASARWNPVSGFSFGYNDYKVGDSPCLSGDQNGSKCVILSAFSFSECSPVSCQGA